MGVGLRVESSGINCFFLLFECFLYIYIYMVFMLFSTGLISGF